MLYKVTNYRHLEKGKTYRIFDSMGDSSVHVFKGFHYDDEIRDDILVLKPVDGELTTEMYCGDFKGALDDEKAQSVYRKMCDDVVNDINIEGFKLEVALWRYDDGVGQSFAKTLHQAGKTIKDFREDITPRIDWHREKPEV
jgi:hypothetical protein